MKKIIFSEKQFIKKFKHAKDFGIEGKPNIENLQKFQTAIEAHIRDKETIVLNGTFRGLKVVHYLNTDTGLNVIVNASAQFHTGWKLNAAQQEHVLLTGKLGGS